MNWNQRYAAEIACKCHNYPMSQCPDVSTEYLDKRMPTDQERLESSINSRVNSEIIKQIL